MLVGSTGEHHSLSDPVALLVTAFRTARSVEAWNVDESMGISENHRVLSDTAAVQIAKYSGESIILDFFRFAADSLMEGPDVEYSDLPALTLDDTSEWLRFKPTLVVTFVGAIPARLEFDLVGHRVLFQCHGEWGIYALTPDALAAASSRMDQTERDARTGTEPTRVVLHPSKRAGSQ
jgi:hypothetical protein